jgi:trans-feruloyl-CoA hydratase/vanillin synthase
MESTMDFASLKTVKVEHEDGIAWTIMNRPEKRNAMSPEMHFEMDKVLAHLSTDEATKCIVLTGAGTSYCAGQDLKEFFRGTKTDAAYRASVEEVANRWRWDRLSAIPKPTIAMVNGFCVGGAFTHMIACDFAIAASDAVFSVSEINWGAIPGGLVSRVLTEALGYRDALDLALTGRAFDGDEASRMRLVNKAVPAAELREVTKSLARELMSKNPVSYAQSKKAVRMVRSMAIPEAYTFISAISDQNIYRAGSNGRDRGIAEFLDSKSYKPTFGTYVKADTV